VYVDRPDGSVRFRWVKAPTSGETTQLVYAVVCHVGAFLGRQGPLERNPETSYLAGEALETSPMGHPLSHTMTYRVPATDMRRP